MSKLKLEDFRQQAEFRYQLRRFLRASELSSRAVGLEPNQYQLLLAIKGLPKSSSPNIHTLADRLLIEQHSAVELVNRSEKRGIVERFRHGSDRRMVFLRITELGEKLLHEVAMRNRAEIINALPSFLSFLNSL
jgi:DNA-binding MarR family transcriptional regulator